MVFFKKAAFIILFMSLAGMQSGSQITGKVVCFGDSITNGAEVNGQSWIQYLSQKHPDIDFVEAGQNGRKTADKQDIIPVLQAHSNADHFLIFLGVNDLKDGTPQMVEQCVKNMRWMIRKVQEANPTTKITILAPSDINLETMAPVNVKKKYNENTKRSLVQLRDQYRKLADDESVQFWSLLDAVSPQNYVDGLHPDTTGQKQIAEAVWKGLTQLYR
ncbi:SGNH/GDSL hydrolase family protein [Fodinibius salsisoli]|uniref:SGNH/GDSL hydrolase family protein n=1 Tax=Fodinibius salsisoli TaxID=2820877 RepID=A0ABT3PLH8_9BACT|nr:SGNH/GDSL hydrolase family protein [Fodinibius salsisoli]MCW9706583.1 SGNH/GDSL hydrolase family protein [Fodinibius salsisoli]